MYLVYDYCHSSEQDVIDHITNRVTWGDEIITGVYTIPTSGGDVIFNVDTVESVYYYAAPVCEFHGHYPALFPFGPEYLAVLFTMALTPLALAWVMTAIRRLL